MSERKAFFVTLTGKSDGKKFHGKNNGFTLLEIMLVLVLLGIATAIVLPTLAPPDSASKLKADAERFAALVKAGHEESLLLGKDLGIVIDSSGYRFVRWQSGEWQSLASRRVFKERQLPEAIAMSFTPGQSIWRKAIEEEESEAEDTSSLFDDSEDDDKQSRSQPNLLLWSSGEISPGEVRFYSASDNSRFFSVILGETGDVTVTNGMDGRRS